MSRISRHARRASRTNAYVYYGHSKIRIFFTEILSTIEHRQLIHERLVVLPGVVDIYGIRFHPHYVAVQWSSRASVNGVYAQPEVIEETLIAALSDVFGWNTPTLRYLKSHRDIERTAKKLRLNWELGNGRM